MKPNTLYKLIFPDTYKDYKDYYVNLLNAEEGEHVLCLGEMTNMPDHYIIVGRNGKIVWGLHADLFRELRVEEI